MGGSIAAMHSAALTAIVAPAVISYPWQLHVASFVFGILVSAFALLVGFRERFHAGFMIRKLFTAFILGCGIHLLRPFPTFPAANACWLQPALGFAPKIFSFAPGAIVLFNSARSLLEITGQWNDCVLPSSSFATHVGLSVQDIRTSWWSEILPHVAATRTGLETHTCLS